MEVSGEVAERIERRLDALGLRPEEVDARVGLPPGTTERLRAGRGSIPGGRFLRGLCAALDTDEEYLLGLEPGDLVPAELLVEPQGELGLLAADEEALLRHYRSLSLPLRAAVALLVAKAAGVEEGDAERRGPQDTARPKDTRQPRKARRPEMPRLLG
jgi:transcriptional regulator with XRE-family HTH domain